MSNVNLSIGGRSYTVNCAAGEEDHVAELGQIIDGKLASMGQSNQSEARSLLFAALLLADEVYELRSGASDGAAPAQPTAAQPVIAPDRLEAIADRLENLASHLEA
jgi:cell division protein ZapA